MISRKDFALTYEPGVSPFTEDVVLRLMVAGRITINLRQQEIGSLDLRNRAEHMLLDSAMQHVYGDVESEIRELQRIVMDNCGPLANRQTIRDAFFSVLVRLHHLTH